tara:strand:- start:6664 stop:7143 length:480 start_codon:yes stop_codon:yes gene_type:complete
MIDFTRYPNNVLPLPLLKTHSLKRKSMRLESKMDSGYSRSRRRFKNPPTEMAVSFLFSNDQQEIFEGWYHHIINAGTDWFVMPVKVGSVVTDHECKFIGDYSQKSPSKNLWTITAKLLVKNLRVISEDETIGRIHEIAQPTQVVRDELDEVVTDYVNEG